MRSVGIEALASNLKHWGTARAKPVLVSEELMGQCSALFQWNPKALMQRKLLSDITKIPLQASTPRAIAASGGSLAQTASSSRMMSMEVLLKRMQSQEDDWAQINGIGNATAVFEIGLFDRYLPELYQDFLPWLPNLLHPAHSHCVLNNTISASPDSSNTAAHSKPPPFFAFSAGLGGSGVGFHTHAASWFLLAGPDSTTTKHWLLSPPGSVSEDIENADLLKLFAPYLNLPAQKLRANSKDSDVAQADASSLPSSSTSQILHCKQRLVCILVFLETFSQFSKCRLILL
jgi:hypothetical protein